MDSSKELSVLLQEYNAVKEEQRARIGFRDNMIYVTLAAVGSVVSFSISKDGPNAALLVVPWLGFILGWSYLVNDQKISAIGAYVREDFARRIGILTGSDESWFGWEIAHRRDRARVGRKMIQFIVDLLTFVGSGVGCVVLYWARAKAHPPEVIAISGFELLLLSVLSIEMLRYLDWKKQRESPDTN
jgi:hypothetical protein